VTCIPPQPAGPNKHVAVVLAELNAIGMPEAGMSRNRMSAPGGETPA
jgi:hypothetical protein